jgi:hypothetical protein
MGSSRGPATEGDRAIILRMAKATHASVVLARFDDLRETGPLATEPWPGCLFLKAAADVRAASQTAKSQQAFKFAIYGLHESEASARRAVDERLLIAPWIEGAIDVWAAVLRPFRHFGEANFLDRAAPGPLFDVTAPTPPADTPIVITTTVGWHTFDDEAIERIRRFGEGVTAVRVGMTGLSGLHSQQTFSFPGGLEDDGITVTFWKDLASATAFAYGPGFHRRQVKIQREGPYGDRTSFTRYEVLHAEGKWHGSDPMAH